VCLRLQLLEEADTIGLCEHRPCRFSLDEQGIAITVLIMDVHLRKFPEVFLMP